MFNVNRSSKAPASLLKRTSWTEADVIYALKEDFHDKCYICETKSPYINVEHFHAHSDDASKMYDWNNLFYACARCNNIKRHLFNNLIDCTNSDTDALRLIKHFPPLTPYSGEVIITPTDADPKTIQTADLIRKVYTDDNTGIKTVTGAALRKRIYKRYAKLVEQLNIYDDEDSLQSERDVALERIRNLMSRSQEYSAFLRWAILVSPELLSLVGDSID